GRERPPSLMIDPAAAGIQPPGPEGRTCRTRLPRIRRPGASITAREGGTFARVWIAIAVAGVFAIGTAPATRADERPFADSGCLRPWSEGAVVAGVAGPASLLLADGREVRLAGIEAVHDGPRADEAEALLSTLATGRTAELRWTGETTDRY